MVSREGGLTNPSYTTDHHNSALCLHEQWQEGLAYTDDRKEVGFERFPGLCEVYLHRWHSIVCHL